jgi:hypothetical protein
MQSNAARAGLGILLVAVAVVLFIVLQDNGSGDEESSGSPSATVETEQDGGSKGDADMKTPSPPPIPEIVVRNGAPVGGVQEIDATSGDEVRFRVLSDEDGDVHMHGYEIERPVSAGKAVTVSFRADLEGGYEIELHSHTLGDIPIAELAVSPG